MRLLAALLLSLLALLPAPGNTADSGNLPDLRTAARAAGLPDTISIVEDPSIGLNAYYTPGGTVCMFWGLCAVIPEHIALGDVGSGETRLFALLHEVLHYHWKAYPSDAPYEERAADAFAARQLCAWGLNGPEVGYQALLAIGGRDVSRDSSTHGSFAERLTVLRSLRCRGEAGSEAL